MMRRKQNGMVLVTVLLIVALVALVAHQLLYQQTLSLKRSSLNLHQAQIQAMETGLVQWVKTGLAQDGAHTDIDHLGQPWAQPMLPVQFGGGEIAGRLWDAQARLNLNAPGLVDSNALFERWQGVYRRMGQNRDVPQGLAALLADWVDQDTTPRAQGAEADQYLLQRPPRRSADRPMVLAQEMTQLLGMDWLRFQPLQADVVALPEATPVNVNTASASVLTWLAESITPDLAQQWIEWRRQAPAENNQAFRSFLAQTSGQTLAQIETALPDDLISVRSAYFLLQGEVRLGSLSVTVWALFHRSRTQGQPQVQLIQRWQSALS